MNESEYRSKIVSVFNEHENKIRGTKFKNSFKIKAYSTEIPTIPGFPDISIMTIGKPYGDCIFPFEIKLKKYNIISNHYTQAQRKLYKEYAQYGKPIPTIFKCGKKHLVIFNTNQYIEKGITIKQELEGKGALLFWSYQDLVKWVYRYTVMMVKSDYEIS